jgi:hypothetical protein
MEPARESCKEVRMRTAWYYLYSLSFSVQLMRMASRLVGSGRESCKEVRMRRAWYYLYSLSFSVQRMRMASRGFCRDSIRRIGTVIVTVSLSLSLSLSRGRGCNVITNLCIFSFTVKNAQKPHIG